MRIISRGSRTEKEHETGEIYGIVSTFVVPCDDLPALSRTDLPSKSKAVVHQVPMRQAPTGTDSRSRAVDADTTTESLVEAVAEPMIGSVRVEQMEG